MSRWGMVIDLQKCVGCYACMISCKQEHFLPPGIFWNRVLIGESGRYPSVSKLIRPVVCNHCEEAPCVEVCPTGATTKREDGIVLVDYDKCVGCKACARACPRNLITMAPFKSSRMLVVACSNQDAAADVRAVCKVGCLGCKACIRVAPDLITMDGALPTINYDNYDPTDNLLEKALEKCPRKRLTFVGRPSEKDLAAVAHEELPEHIEPDFKTTVDDTEWRG